MKNEPTYKIIGVDPGTSTLGLAVLTLNGAGDIISITTECIDASKVKTKFYRNQNLEYRLRYISEEISKRVSEHKPIGFAIEMPFINPRRIGSVIPLARLLGILMNIVLGYNPYMLIYKKSPSEVKNAVGAKGNADKDGMLEATLKIDEISKLIDLNKLTDHEVDAIAISYALVSSIRKVNMLPIF